ncbi:MAG TPA: CD225/dispanin family protein [Panacibacter sp.]|nr:CD225/dispanin family protein [Panacibacter sp.]
MDQNYQQNPSLQQPPLTPPKNWLVESILVTILCCLPFGIAGIVFASQVNTKYAAGDYNGALQASKDAGKWTKIGFWIGIGWIILSVIWVVFVIGVAAFTTRFGHY